VFIRRFQIRFWVIAEICGDPIEEAAGGVKVLSEKTGSDDNCLVIQGLQILFYLERYPDFRTG